MKEHWSLGVLIGLPIIGVLLLICLVWAVFVFLFVQYEPGFVISFPLAGIVILLAILGFGYYPYGSQYHKWKPVSGQVQDLSARLVSDGDGMSQKIVVVINGQEYGCNDTRCALVKKADVLDLSCIRSWQWSSTPGYDCRFVARKAA